MKRTINIISVVATTLLLTTLQPLFGQQRIDPVLQVERSFDSRLLEITKSDLLDSFPDSLNRFNLNFDYSIFDKPIANLYEFKPMAPAEVEQQEGGSPHKLQLKIGANYPFNPYGSLHYSPLISKQLSLPLSITHNSHLAKLSQVNLADGVATKGERVNFAPFTNSGAEFKPTLHWKRGELSLLGGYTLSRYSYWGFSDRITQPPSLQSYSSMRDSLSNGYQRAYVGFDARSRNKNHNTFHYRVKVDYSTLTATSNWITKTSLLDHTSQLNTFKGKEDHLSLLLSAGVGFANYNTIGLVTKFNSASQLTEGAPTRNLVELHPSYSFRKGNWLLSLGLKYNRWLIDEKDDYDLFVTATANLELFKEKLWFYGKLDGESHFNSYQLMVESAPWLAANPEIEDGSSPIVAEVGFKALIAKRVSLNLFGGYSEHRNGTFFMTNLTNFSPEEVATNSLTPFYQDQHKYRVGANISYNSTPFEGMIHGEYIRYDKLKEHYNSPNYLLSATLRYNWRERVYLSTNWLAKGKRLGLLSTPSPIFDEEATFENCTLPAYILGNVTLSYRQSTLLTFSLHLNNLLNSTIVEYGTYALPNFNGGLSVEFNF